MGQARRRRRRAAAPCCEISWQAAHSADDVVGAEVLHLVDEHGDAVPAAGRPARATSASSSTRSISMSPESARPGTAGTSMPGCHGPVLAALALREGLDHAQDVPRLVVVAAGQLAHGEVQRPGQRPADRLVGPGLELAGAPAAAHRGRTHRVEQHGLADAAQPGEHDRAFRPPAGHPLEQHVEAGQLAVAAGEFGRALAGAGGVGVAHRVHDRTVSGSLARPDSCAEKPRRRVGSCRAARRRALGSAARRGQDLGAVVGDDDRCAPTARPTSRPW